MSDHKVPVVPGDSALVPASSLMNADRLPPNPDGVRYVLFRLQQQLMQAFPDTPENALRFR